ncbi:hypothetical protein DM860_005940 [Cuscuta australis]|uniref:E3 ubiquitin-protein ligase RMA n=1 Tax=Cuscuta australis TaxID=267555 RepID=A0A328DT28_9ASTE|nr:hypothetical protein DM860_005940 [Cuscuta australis]
MGDETGNRMNLDLNLGPVDHPRDYLDLRSFPHGSITLEELFARQRSQLWPESSHGLLVDGRVREGVTQRRQCSDIQRWLSMQRDLIPAHLIPVSPNASSGEKGKGEEEKEEEDDDDDNAMSFFDCNICLDLAREPVVTCCGHLYCWPCLYRWLNLHSNARECPVCKGEVTAKTVTPIYGRGGGGTASPCVEAQGSLKIPQRPQATRHESWRQTIQRSAFTSIPVEEMIRRLGSRFDTTANPEESPERRNSLLARILTSRGMRREQPNTVETYLRNNPFERNQEVYTTVDDRDSVSSIAAMIQSESQTGDTVMETDSSWRRITDVDSGDSRPPRRRRLY